MLVISFTDLGMQLTKQFGVDIKLGPVGKHFVHDKVEQKIQEIKKARTLVECREFHIAVGDISATGR